MNKGMDMQLYKALNMKNKEMIALVGGGGKTTSMYALAKDLKKNKKVLIATTTAIYLPQKDQTNCIVIGKDIKKSNIFLKENAHLNHIVGFGRKITPEGKLKGVDPKALDFIYEEGCFDYIIVEADGAKHKPLKGPASHEPAIPCKSSLVIIVVGIDACGKILNEENVHRPQMIAHITKMQIGQKITPQVIAEVVTSKKGLLKGIPDHARIFLLINKLDSKKGYNKAYEIAKIVRGIDGGKIEKILLCNMLDNQVLKIL